METPPGTTVRIHYRRPPDRLDIFEQRLVLDAPDLIITLLERAGVSRPLLVDGCRVLARRSPILWFTFPGRWHDVGRFHDEHGRFTGYYANVITPVRVLADSAWETTDLYLDVWVGADGAIRLLDEDELEAAFAAGQLEDGLYSAARAEAARLLGEARRGVWPPEVVREWTLERAREALSRKHSGAEPV